MNAASGPPSSVTATASSIRSRSGA
jgi:hypothetical protein